jgi:site-specific recombinase XerD
MRNNSSLQSDQKLDATTLLDLRLEHLKPDRTPATLRRYQSALQRFLSWYEEVEHHPLAIEDLTPIALVGYRNALQKTESPSTVNTHLSALRAWCKWLVDAGHLENDPAARVKLVSRQAPPAPKSLKAAEVNALLRAAGRSRHPLRNTAILQMFIQTGIRIGECAALNWRDIEFGEKRGKVLIRSGKGNKARSVPLNGSARQTLADYAAPLLQVEPTLRAVAAAWPQQEDLTPLWQSQKKGRMTTSAIQRMINELVTDCVAKESMPADTSAHTLRHTFATHYLESNARDLAGLASLLGHSSLNTTHIYVHPTAEDLAQRIEELDLNAYE